MGKNNCYNCKFFRIDKKIKNTAYKGKCINPLNHKISTDISEICNYFSYLDTNRQKVYNEKNRLNFT